MARNKSDHLRQELAQTAAKLIAVDGIVDYLAAKKKAADLLGIQQSKLYPSNREIEQALIHYQSLFQSSQQQQNLNRLRKTALNAMKLFEDLKPRLVGPVLNGTATEYSEITLHIYTDSPETLATRLMDLGIPFDECQRRASFTLREQKLFPAISFLAGEDQIVLILFPEKKKNQSPLNSVDGHPEKRVNLEQATRLFQDALDPST